MFIPNTENWNNTYLNFFFQLPILYSYFARFVLKFIKFLMHLQVVTYVGTYLSVNLLKPIVSYGGFDQYFFSS
jgi:hypothetical protein